MTPQLNRKQLKTLAAALDYVAEMNWPDGVIKRDWPEYFGKRDKELTYEEMRETIQTLMSAVPSAPHD